MVDYLLIVLFSLRLFICVLFGVIVVIGVFVVRFMAAG